MSVQSHTENQTNSSENKNDHAGGVEYCEDSDTWECGECGARKFDEEGALRCCGDDDENELSISSSHAPPEALHERDVWLCWGYKERDGRDTKVPINPATGGMGSSTNPDSWADYETARDYNERVGYVFAEEGLHAGVDLDNVRDPDTGEIEPWAEEVIDELDSYTELSPSGTGFHIVVFGMKPGDNCKVGMESTLDCFDEAEIEMYEDGRFFTYTGDHVEGTPTTIERRNGSLSEVYNEHLADDDGGSVATAEVEGSKPDLDLSDERILEKARNAENGEKFNKLYDGSDALHGNDTSRADKAFCQLLAYWTGGDRSQMDRLFRDSRRMRAKWNEDRGNQTYGEKTIDAALSDQSEFYDPSHGEDNRMATRSSVEHESVADALVEEPEVWIDPDGQVITARAVGGMSADDVADHLRGHELPGEASVVKTAGELDSEYQSAFLDFCNDSAGEWTVTTDRSRSNEWRKVRDAYTEMSKTEARDKAFRQLNDEIDVATFRDTKNLVVYNPDKGIYERHGDTVIEGKLANKLQHYCTTHEIQELKKRTKYSSYCNRDEFGPSEDEPMVCLANGVLDLSGLSDGDSIEFHNHSPAWEFLSALPVEYNPDAECPNFDKTLDKIFNDETSRQLIYEMFGYCLLPGYPYKKAFFLHGEGNNGKSTVLKPLRKLLGEDNISASGLHTLENNTFATSDLYDKMANISGEEPKQKLDKSDKFKKATGGDLIRAEEKGEGAFKFENQAKFIFALNEIPRVVDTTDGMLSRLLFVEFPNEFTEPGKPGPDKRAATEVEAEITTPEELSGILNKSISAIADVMQRGGFITHESVEGNREFLKAETEPVYGFMKERTEEDPDGYIPKKDLHEAYNSWAREEGRETFTRSDLGERLKNDSGISTGRPTVDGERKRVYSGITFQ